MESDSDSALGGYNDEIENEIQPLHRSPSESGYSSPSDIDEHELREGQRSPEVREDDDAFDTIHGRLGQAFANAQPTPTILKKFGCQVFMFAVFVVIFAIFIGPCAFWIQYSEREFEMLRIAEIRESSNELEKYRTTFKNKLCDMFEENQNVTIEEIDFEVKEFLEIYYGERYDDYRQDLQALDFILGKNDRSWNLGKIVESLLSVMMLTGSDTVFYKTVLGRSLMFTIAFCGAIMVTILLSSAASLTVIGINKCFLIFKVSQSKNEKNYARINFTVDLATLIIITVCCAGSIFLGAMTMKNDQPSWSYQEAALYTFSQATTMGNSHFLPDRMAMSQQTFYSVFLYASIRIFTMYWMTCLALAILKLFENLDKIAQSVVSPLGINDILFVDRARMRRQKNVQYMD